MKNFISTVRVLCTTVMAIALSGLLHSATASPVTLQQPTATFSQTFVGDFSIARAINGTIADNLGWAIAVDASTAIPSQTAAFETATDVGFAGGSIITFTLNHGFIVDYLQHTLGRLRLSVTTDNRSLFADGLASGGDVTANWIVLNPSSFNSANGATLTKLGDLSILASGFSPDTDIYVISAPTLLTGITGVRLEAIEDSSLPFGGPGRQPVNGNFVLSEFQMDIVPVPEPSMLTLIIVGGFGCVVLRRSRVC